MNLTSLAWCLAAAVLLASAPITRAQDTFKLAPAVAMIGFDACTGHIAGTHLRYDQQPTLAILPCFTRCVLPHGSCSVADIPEGPAGAERLELVEVRTVGEALDALMDW